MTLKKSDPLHGVTLAMMLEYLEKRFGWEELGRRIQIRCFNFDPTINSSLKFLRRTPWARAKVEELYVKCMEEANRESKRGIPASEQAVLDALLKLPEFSSMEDE